MSALPFLGNLRLSEPTGVPVTLYKRPSTSKDGDKAQRLDSAKDEAGKDPTTNEPVDDFTTEEKAREQLDELLSKLSGDYASMPDSQAKSDKIKESRDFVQQWREAICVNMNAKRKLYDIELRRLKDEIKNEHEKQLRILEAAQRPLSEVGSDPQSQGNDKDTILLRPLNKTDNKWEYVEKDRWRELNSQTEDIQKLQNDIAQRVERLRKADSWRQSVAHFVNTLKKLRDYPQLSEMTEKIVDSVVAFVNNSAISSNQFYNVMLMGAAGTGKTRLASIIASIFAQLGMYVHERLVEAQAGDFIGQYLGETAAKSRKFLSRNMERVIFLDEAYALTHYDAEAERRNPGERKLDQYSDEAVNVLIPHLSENVGQMAMIVAGYENRMKKDFLPANEGMGRRFPIRATLTNYKKEDLYKIFLKQAAVSFVGKRPAKEADVVAYESSVEVQRGTLAAMFTRDAEQLFYDVASASESSEYPKLRKLFEAQAGAMTNMAGVASSLLLATGEKDLTGMVADRRAMFNIILTFIQSVFTGFEGETMQKEADLARKELLDALRAKNWFEKKDGWDVWKTYQKVECATDEQAPNCAQPAEAFVADKFYTKDDFRAIVDDEDYACALERIWEPPAQAPTVKNTPKSASGSSASSVTDDTIETLEVALAPETMKDLFPFLDKDGNYKRTVEVNDLPAGYDDKVVPKFKFTLSGAYPFDLTEAEEKLVQDRAYKENRSAINAAVTAAKARKKQLLQDILIQQRLFKHLLRKREAKAEQKVRELAKRKEAFLKETLEKQTNADKEAKKLRTDMVGADEDVNMEDTDDNGTGTGAMRRQFLRERRESAMAREAEAMSDDEEAPSLRRSERNR